MKPAYRIVIIEPSQIIQRGLNAVIADNPSFVVVGELYDASHLEDKIASLRADIVIVNPCVIDFNKRASIKHMFPEIAIIALLYSHIDNEILRQFNGIIDIYDSANKIINKLTEAVSERSTEEASSDTDLSEREKEILIAVAKGMMNKEIASLHNISIHTVISHRKNISRKTGIKSVSGFVVYALLNNLLEQSDLQ